MKSCIPCAGVLLSAFLCSNASVENGKLYYLKANEKNAPAVYAITNNSSWTASDGSSVAAGPLDGTATYCVKNNWYLRTLPWGESTAFNGGCHQIGEPGSQGRLIIYGGNESSPLSFEGSQRGLSIVRGQVSSQQRYNEIRGAVKISNTDPSPTLSWYQDASTLVLSGSLYSEEGAEWRIGTKDDMKQVNPSNITLRILSDCSGFVGSLGVESPTDFIGDVFGRRIEFGNVKLGGTLTVKNGGTILTTVSPGQTVELNSLRVLRKLRVEVGRNGLNTSLFKVTELADFQGSQGSIEIKTLWNGIGDIKTGRPLRFAILEIPQVQNFDESVFRLTSGDEIGAGASLKWKDSADGMKKVLYVAYPARGSFCVSVR